MLTFDRENYISAFSDILSLRDLADSTINNYLSYLNQFFDYVDSEFPGRKPDDLTWEEIRSYFRLLKDVRKLNNRSINPRIAQLCDFFYYVLHREWDRYQIPYLKYDVYLPPVPTGEEMETIILTLGNLKYQCIIALMYSAGLRVSEAVALRYKDICRSRMQIHVAKSKNRSERKAILAQRTLNMLIYYWLSQGKPNDPEAYLFPGQKPGSHISKESVRIVMRDHLSSLGWQDKGYTPHSCRHCFGLTLYESGADLLAIRDAMGHKSLSSTVVYASLGIGSDHGLKSPFDTRRQKGRG